jgi:recombination protein RecT
MSDQAKTTDAGNVSQLPSKASFKRLAECDTLGEAFQTKELRDLIAGAIPRHMEPDRMLRAFVQAAGKAPLIYKCDMRQAIGAMMSLTYLGLVPGTVLQHAHLIPFAKTKWNPATRTRDPDGYDLQVVIGYQGYVELAMRSGFVKDISAAVVLPPDHLDWERGSKRFLTHKETLNDTTGMTPRGAWALAKFINDGEEFEIMSWPDILKIRNRSQGYQAALRQKEAAEEKGRRPPPAWTEAPWVAHEREMGKKTVIRRLAKLLPKCPDLHAGIGIEEAQDAGKKLDFGPVIDGTALPEEGIPEKPEPDAPGDPGATFGVRGGAPEDQGGPPGDEPPPEDEGGQTKGTTQQKPKPGATRQQKPAKPAATKPRQEPPRQPAPTQPVFETILLNAYGEVGETYTDQVAFARAIVALWLNSPAAEAGQIVEHNADALAEAELVPAAALILKGLNEPHPGDADENESGAQDSTESEDPPTNESEDGGEPGGEPMPWAAVAPPQHAGKPAWSVWPTLMRDEMATVDPGDLEAWAGVQQAVIAEAPVQQRTIVVRALATQFTAHLQSPPDWLAALDPQAANDEKWLADREADLRAMKDDQTGRRAFDTLMRMDMVRTVMGRLHRTAPALFERATKMFADKNAKLPRAAGAEAP